MTSPHDRPLPPLTDLPSPPRLPEDSPELVPPGEIMVESRPAIIRTLLRICWMPALVLIGLWYTLLFLYVAGTSPTFWLLSLLSTLFEPAFFRRAVLELGFTTSGLWTAFLLLPVLATGLSLALLPLVSRALAGMNPRHHLSEAGFQRAVATRATAILLLPPMLTVTVLCVLVAQPFGQLPFLHWPSLSAGPLTALCTGAGAIMLAWLWIRSWVNAPRILGIEPAGRLETEARLGRNPDTRRAAARRVLAQDRRHLPPAPGSPESTGATTLRGAGTSLALIARACLTWVVPAMLCIGFVVFGMMDLVSVFSGIGQADLQAVRSAPLGWPALLAGLLALGLTACAAAVAPALAVKLAEPQRTQVLDQRTYPAWAHRARVNPWEVRVASLVGWFTSVAGLLAITLAIGVLELVGAATALAWTLAVLTALTAMPLLGLAAAAAMRVGLRDVLYGPAHRYMRREAPHALVAPDIGTRADRAKDPAVRAHLRQRLKGSGEEHALEIFDLDAAGERLWVDDSLPGATSTQVREADVARGRLPDFGGDGSPFAAAPEDGGGRSSTGRTGHGAAEHDIPDTVTGLRER